MTFQQLLNTLLTLTIDPVYILRRIKHSQSLAVAGQGFALCVHVTCKCACSLHIAIVCKILCDELFDQRPLLKRGLDNRRGCATDLLADVFPFALVFLSVLAHQWIVLVVVYLHHGINVEDERRRPKIDAQMLSKLLHAHGWV